MVLHFISSTYYFDCIDIRLWLLPIASHNVLCYHSSIFCSFLAMFSTLLHEWFIFLLYRKRNRRYVYGLVCCVSFFCFVSFIFVCYVDRCSVSFLPVEWFGFEGEEKFLNRHSYEQNYNDIESEIDRLRK